MAFNFGHSCNNDAGASSSGIWNCESTRPGENLSPDLNSRLSPSKNSTPSEVFRQPQSAEWTKTVPDTMPWFNRNNSFRGFTVSNQEMYQDFQKILKINDSPILIPSSSSVRQNISKKRPLFDLDDGPRQKQRMTDAKFARSFDSLRISDDHSVPLVNSEVQRKQAKLFTFEELEASIKDEDEELAPIDGDMPVLEMSDEMKNMCKNTVPGLALQNRPCNAVVLWQPPGGIINELLRFTKSNSSEDLPEKDEEKFTLDIRTENDVPFDTEVMDFF